jgi:hypothetical protein
MEQRIKAPGAFYVRPPPLQQVTVGAPPGESGFESLSPALPRGYWGAAVHTSYRTPWLIGNNPTATGVVPGRLQIMT